MKKSGEHTNALQSLLTKSLFGVVVFLIFMAFLSVPAVTFAGITTNASVYVPTDSILVTCAETGAGVHMFDITSGIDGSIELGGSIGWFSCSDTVAQVPYGVNIDHTYVLVELDTGTNCDGLDYSACKTQPYYLAEVTFSVVEENSSGGGGGSGGFTPTLSMDKNPHYPDDLISVQCTYSSSALQLYDSTQTPYLNVGRFECINSVASFSFGGEIGHSYTLLEIGHGEQCDSSYDACRGVGSFVNQVSFSVVEAPPALTSGLMSYRPEVHVLAPKDGDVFSRAGTITYVATDGNDRGTLDERTRLGLIEGPVTLYYSDKIVDWDHSIIPLEDKTLIEKGQPARGTYSWKVNGLLPGIFYRVVVDAVDATGTVGEDISGLFTVDFESPAFTVTADPPVTRSKPVTITVVSSKELKEPPIVNVMQKGGELTAVTMEGAGKEFVGTYTIIPGFDGIATIGVVGSDFVGNKGNTIISGGTFAVGIDPPPKPVIENLPDELITSSSTIHIAGTARDDTRVIVRVNGVVQATTTPLADGTFVFPNVRLSITVNRGVNTISLSTIDQAGSESESATIRVKYNSDPVISIISPKLDATFGGKFAIDVSATDENIDPLLFTYQIILEKEYAVHAYTPGLATSSVAGWTTLAELVPSARLSWDSTEVEDGRYVLRVLAYDGTVSIVSPPVAFSIRNTGPYFRFEDGRKTITSTTSATVVGRALAPSNISPAPTITKAEYSRDNGLTWKVVTFTSGSSTPEARFSIRFTELSEGVNGLLWRVTDSRGISGRTSHPIVVDRTPPRAPVIRSPKHGAIISLQSDSNKIHDGVQIDISGTAEPASVVTLENDGVKTRAKVGADGTFVFRGVDAGKHGAHRISLEAHDDGGNGSEQVVREYINNNPPRVSILSPKNLRAVKGSARVTWLVTDSDEDTILEPTLKYRKGTAGYVTLPIDPTSRSYDWDLDGLSEGGPYELVLEVGDGYVRERAYSQFSIDTVPPRIDSFTLTHSTIGAKASLQARGTASDRLSGIEYVEYALVDPNTSDPPEWVTGTVTNGFLQKNALFAIEYPVRLDDGAYELRVRAVDAAGNTSESISRRVVVDTSPPRIGSFALSSGDVHIPPTSDGSITVYETSPVAFSIALEGDTASATLGFDGKTLPLTKNIVSGLWETALASPPSGTYTLTLSAEDVASNMLPTTEVGRVVTVPHGRVYTMNAETGEHSVPNVLIRVLVLNERGQFVHEPSRAGLHMVQPTEDGFYELMLSSGQYQVAVSAPGYARVVRPVTLAEAGVVTETFELRALSPFGAFVQSIFDYFGYSS